jgi:hypothetical protein
MAKKIVHRKLTLRKDRSSQEKKQDRLISALGIFSVECH